MGTRHRLRPPPGTADLLAADAAGRLEVLATVAEVARTSGHAPLWTPVVEDADLVAAVIGPAAVSVADADGEDERGVAGTPGVLAAAVRAHVAHGMPSPWKVWTALPVLTRAAEGVRERIEIGLQAVGSADPDLDVDAVVSGLEVLARLGLARTALVVGRGAAADAADGDGDRRLARVTEGLSERGIDFVLDDALPDRAHGGAVLAFEVQEPTGRALLWGGHHRGVLPGAPDVVGSGWTTTVETLLAADAVVVDRWARVDAFVVDVTGGATARDLTRRLRDAGVATDRAYDDRSMRAQMKAADRSGAEVALIVGPEEEAAGEVTVRWLRTDDAQRRVARADVVTVVRAALDDP